ncbi:hypothetical protein B484DRAFT_256246 [Ochromonadaceae sp. CCMP2298]|nr:hypothetical protein B484DRAFT_256246 [Ochromonadaceae sp. CCMP2298]|mmetsp:Transcript_16479/g.36979  ORF Transcript_16479/g.36979 Transcript_16479/m.36979 type:complete len:178 (-) Transcript_16479:468-1001(-)
MEAKESALLDDDAKSEGGGECPELLCANAGPLVNPSVMVQAPLIRVSGTICSSGDLSSDTGVGSLVEPFDPKTQFLASGYAGPSPVLLSAWSSPAEEGQEQSENGMEGAGGSCTLPDPKFRQEGMRAEGKDAGADPRDRRDGDKDSGGGGGAGNGDSKGVGSRRAGEEKDDGRSYRK